MNITLISQHHPAPGVRSVVLSGRQLCQPSDATVEELGGVTALDVERQLDKSCAGWKTGADRVSLNPERPFRPSNLEDDEIELAAELHIEQVAGTKWVFPVARIGSTFPIHIPWTVRPETARRTCNAIRFAAAGGLDGINFLQAHGFVQHHIPRNRRHWDQIANHGIQSNILACRAMAAEAGITAPPELVLSDRVDGRGEPVPVEVNVMLAETAMDMGATVALWGGNPDREGWGSLMEHFEALKKELV